MTYMNAESIKKYDLNRNKVNVTLKPMITTTSVSKYQNIALTQFMLKIEVNTQRVDMGQSIQEWTK